MDDLLPNKKPYIPKLFQKITMNIGTPMVFDDIIKQLRDEKKDAVSIFMKF